MVGTLLMHHSPEAVRRMRLSEARACLRAIHQHRKQQVELMGALLGAGMTR